MLFRSQPQVAGMEPGPPFLGTSSTSSMGGLAGVSGPSARPLDELVLVSPGVALRYILNSAVIPTISTSQPLTTQRSHCGAWRSSMNSSISH